jgi:hypothetical protein
MAFPPFAHDEILLESVGISTGPDDVGAYNWVSAWLPVGDVQRISVALFTPNLPTGGAVEEGLYRDTSTEPDTAAWTPLNEVVNYVGPGGNHFRSSVTQVDLTARYFRVHAFGFASASGVFVTARALRRGVR